MGLFLLIFKLDQIPPGIDIDEGAIAYNAALISRTLHDQNGRFMPVFILSADKIDWKQPVLIYISAIVFKIFGSSLIIFKLVNISITLASIILLYLLMKKIFSQKLALLGVLIFFTTPAVIVTSRIGNESIDPVLFSVIWLFSLYLYQERRRIIYLILASISLGIGFYSFKGMRIIVPIWIVLSFGFVLWQHIKELPTYLSLIKSKLSVAKTCKKIHSLIVEIITNKKIIISFFVLFVFLLPFFVVTPLLEMKYAGAVFDRKGINIDPYQHYLYYWISNLSLPSLFFKGDVGLIYTMPLYGFYLLGVIPGFLLGIYESIKERSFYGFVLVCYLTTPLLFGFAGSLDYPHRLMALVPFFVIITTLGYRKIYSWIKLKSSYTINRIFKNIVAFSLISFFVINFVDFSSFYYFEYPSLHSTKSAFFNNLNKPFYLLSKIVEQKGLDPYIQEEIYTYYIEGNKFFEISYFKQPLNTWIPGEDLPPNAALLTKNERVEGATNSNIDVHPFNILIKD